MTADLAKVIDAAWDARDTLNTSTKGEVRDAVEAALEGLDTGKMRVAEKGAGGWVVNQWLKKAVLRSFRLTDTAIIPGGPEGPWFDKVPSKFKGWDDARFRKAGFRRLNNASKNLMAAQKATQEFGQQIQELNATTGSNETPIGS